MGPRTAVAVFCRALEPAAWWWRRRSACLAGRRSEPSRSRGVVLRDGAPEGSALACSALCAPPADGAGTVPTATHPHVAVVEARLSRLLVSLRHPLLLPAPGARRRGQDAKLAARARRLHQRQGTAAACIAAAIVAARWAVSAGCWLLALALALSAGCSRSLLRRRGPVQRPASARPDSPALAASPQGLAWHRSPGEGGVESTKSRAVHPAKTPTLHGPQHANPPPLPYTVELAAPSHAAPGRASPFL
ncbi:hypothetical protein K505DRAFT_393918 [Melanomma pulvis-pyrius CBS 109.77]|uniref:Uncharacterized protein n=1 Tax=Melanomma pulvis-pyrius CBS 109.77 TaxID=1314802 RepID=A0A6A6XQS9_9PLEO|nr:hypothetical protein K505DRAFT_393918 [Melanomma pulvis-pyrius CBS 109.77]